MCSKKYHHKCLIGIPIGLLITLPRSQNDKYMYAISVPNEYCDNLVLILMTLSHYKIYSVSFLCLSFQVLLNHSFLGPLGGKQSKIYINTIKKINSLPTNTRLLLPDYWWRCHDNFSGIFLYHSSLWIWILSVKQCMH